jgi:hypothetical protein
MTATSRLRAAPRAKPRGSMATHVRISGVRRWCLMRWEGSEVVAAVRGQVQYVLAGAHVDTILRQCRAWLHRRQHIVSRNQPQAIRYDSLLGQTAASYTARIRIQPSTRTPNGGRRREHGAARVFTTGAGPPYCARVSEEKPPSTRDRRACAVSGGPLELRSSREGLDWHTSGSLMTGKKYLISTTWNAPLEAFEEHLTAAFGG